MVRPILEYPIIPNALASNHRMRLMQRVQNRNLRNITYRNEETENLDLEGKHNFLNIETINQRMYMRFQKSLDKFAIKEPDLYNKSLEENNNNNSRDHNWWPIYS